MDSPSVFDPNKTLSDDPVLLLGTLAWEVNSIYKAKYATPGERIALSFHAASTAWHLHEWIWKAADQDKRQQLRELTSCRNMSFSDFAVSVQRWAPSIGICRQIATAYKHFTIRHDRPDVRLEVHHDPKREEHAYWLMILGGGKKRVDVDVYLEALKAWSRLYVALGYESAKEIGETVVRQYGALGDPRYPLG